MVVFRYQMLCQLKNNDILSFILVQINKEKQRFVDIIFHRKDAGYAKLFLIFLARTAPLR